MGSLWAFPLEKREACAIGLPVDFSEDQKGYNVTSGIDLFFKAWTSAWMDMSKKHFIHKTITSHQFCLVAVKEANLRLQRKTFLIILSFLLIILVFSQVTNKSPVNSYARHHDSTVKESFNSVFCIYEIEYNFANENSTLPMCLEVSSLAFDYTCGSQAQFIGPEEKHSKLCKSSLWLRMNPVQHARDFRLEEIVSIQMRHKYTSALIVYPKPCAWHSNVEQ